MSKGVSPQAVGGVFAAGVQPVSAFSATSRYNGIPLATVAIAGISVRYATRRFVPQPSRFATVSEYVVVDGDRADNIAAAQLGDPELFWRLADANGIVHPDDLVAEIGRRLRITLPEGIPEAPNVE